MGVLFPYARWYETPAKFKSDMRHQIVPTWSERTTEFVTCNLCQNAIKFQDYITHLRTEPRPLHEIALNFLYYDGVQEEKMRNQLEITYIRENPSMKKLNKIYRKMIKHRPKLIGIHTFSIFKGIYEVLDNVERDLQGPIISRQNLLNIAQNNFIRLLVDEKFKIKTEIGDPPILQKGDLQRENRRRKLIKKLRADIAARRNMNEKNNNSGQEVFVISEEPGLPPMPMINLSDDIPATTTPIDVSDEQSISSFEVHFKTVCLQRRFSCYSTYVPYSL